MKILTILYDVKFMYIKIQLFAVSNKKGGSFAYSHHVLFLFLSEIEHDENPYLIKKKTSL